MKLGSFAYVNILFDGWVFYKIFIWDGALSRILKKCEILTYCIFSHVQASM